ncbi:MAG: diacylglycerol kinase family protein [Phycisphaerae bacterium]|jgi:YegS/Rv2252/BmrU family lipid kinase
MPTIDPALPVHLIINPRSGYGGSRLMLAELRTAIRAAGLDLVEHTTTGPEDAAHYARGIVGQASAAIVWGGDGTANEVADGLSGSSVPMLACPAGTENLLAKELRIPSDPRRIVEVLLDGQIVDCDSGRINGQNFLLIIGVGFDGEVVRRLTAVRTGHISHLSYFWPIWRTFWEHDFPRMRIISDGTEIFNDSGLAFIGNISRYAVGLRICRDARFDDGLLDLVVFSCRERTALVLHAGWTLLRRHPLKGDVLYRQAKRVEIYTSDPVPTQVDGDVGPSTPLEIVVKPRDIKLLVPSPREGWSIWPWRGSDLT